MWQNQFSPPFSFTCIIFFLAFYFDPSFGKTKDQYPLIWGTSQIILLPI
jgi:hypothetical protein